MIVDGLGNTVLTNRFDALGRVVEQVDATCGTSRFEYRDPPEPGVTLSPRTPAAAHSSMTRAEP